MSTAKRPELTQLLRQTSWLQGLAGQLVGDEYDVEDLLQDLWVEGLEGGGDVKNPRAWITCVLRRLVSSSRARVSGRRHRERLAARAEAQEGPGELLETASLQRDLVNEVMGLDEPVRTTVLLRYYENLPPRRIADRMEVPVRTVNSRLARGMVLLRERLDRVRGGREEWFSAAVLFVARDGRGAASASGAGTASADPTGGLLLVQRVLALSIPLLGVVLLGVWAGVWPSGIERSSRAGAVVAQGARTPQDGGGGRAGLEGLGESRPRLGLADRGPLQRKAGVTPGSGLDGIVVTTTGARVRGARIEARFGERTQAMRWTGFDREEKSEGSPTLPCSTAGTDGRGVFHMELDPGGVYDLRVRAEGFQTQDEYRVRVGDAPRIVLRVGGSLEGSVRREWDGKPAAGARILLSPGVLYGGGRGFETQADAQGRYRFEGLPLGRVRIDVTPKVAARRWGFLASISAGETTRMDVVVPRGRRVVGRVVSAETGRPVAGARVGLTHTFYRSARTDEHGDFVLPGADGSTSALEEIRVKADGFGLAIVPRTRDSLGERLFVKLHPGRRVTGRVVRDDGGGVVAGVEVVACGAFDWRSTRTDPEGRFELNGLRSELDHSLLLRMRGFASTFYDFPDDEGEHPSLFLGDVPLLPAASLSGRVVDESGKGISHVFVSLRGDPLTRGILRLRGRASSAYPFRPLEVRTDGTGHFLFVDLQPGSFELSADMKGYAGDCRRQVELDVGKSVEGVVLVMERGKELAGRAFDPGGDPAGGWTVRAIRSGEIQEESYAIVAPDGSFRLWGLAGEDDLLELDDGLLHLASEPNSETRIHVFDGHRAGDTGIELRFPRPSRVAGVFLDPGGRPVAGGIVNLLWDPGVGQPAWIGSASSDAEGRFSFWLGVGDVVRIEGFEFVDRPGEGPLSGVGRFAEPLVGVVAGSEELVLRVAE